MDRREQARRNLELARDHLLGLLDEVPERWPPDGSTIVYVPDDDPELARANLEMLETMRARDPDEVARLHIVTERPPAAPREGLAAG